MWARASSAEARYDARAPMTTASSTSQSVLTLPGGIATSSNGPTTVLGDFMNMTMFSGGAEPDSAAWAA